MISNKKSLEKRLNELLITITDSKDKKVINRSLGVYLALERQYELITGERYDIQTNKRRYK